MTIVQGDQLTIAKEIGLPGEDRSCAMIDLLAIDREIPEGAANERHALFLAPGDKNGLSGPAASVSMLRSRFKKDSGG